MFPISDLIDGYISLEDLFEAYFPQILARGNVGGNVREAIVGGVADERVP